MADKVIKQIHPQGLVLPSLPGQIKELRVAAYARVSTSSDEQMGSVAAQKDYFEKMIIKKPGWILVGIYADEGITGTSMHHRDAFKRMIADAMSGKMDLIITKSLSRFARNTVDTLNTIRQLKNSNVGVYFEKEDIFTLDSKGEFMITLLSSIAEEESRSISENVKWGQRKKFADGKYQVPYKNFLGFCKDPNGSLAIVEKEAQIVRLIYYLFLSGYTVNAIAVMLTKANIPTPARKQIWQNCTVQSILTNEKYYGAALLQKGYSVDYRTKKRKLNHGELPMYYIANDHPGIVTKEIFDEVQQRLSQRPHRTKTTTLFANQLYCADCRGSYTPLSWHSTTTNDTVWKCRNRRMYGYKCTTPHLYEELLKTIFHKGILQLLQERPSIIEDCCTILDNVTGILDFINNYEILSAIESSDINSGIEKHVWRTLIDKVIVHPDCSLEFHIIDGTTIEQIMPSGTPRNLRISQKKKAEILKKYATGIPPRILAEEYEIPVNTIKTYTCKNNAIKSGICHYCGQEYRYSGKYKRQYCSRSCAAKDVHQKKRGKKNDY